MKNFPRAKDFAALLLGTALAFTLSVFASAQLPEFSGGAPLSKTPSSDPLLAGREIPPIAAPAVWNHFIVFVWQFRTAAQRDLELYRRAGFGGFHIDRGAGQEDAVGFARENQLPYYVDHAADKGYLHLTERTGVEQVLRRKELIERPQSFGDAEVMATMKAHLDRNIAATREGPVAAYSFDDEISLGSFNSPAEVDASPAVVDDYRRWLEAIYDHDLSRLNAAWDSDLETFGQAEPISFESMRKTHSAPPFANWRLARWMDWRAFMDSHFAATLAGLTRHANGLDRDTPAGFVGGQQPSPYGGFDYAKLARSVQFMEAYDIGNTNEILRSLWCGRGADRRPFVQTWFSTGDANRDRWFLNYYLAHGNRGVIAWPDAGGRGGPWFDGESRTVAPFIEQNADAVRELHGPLSQTLLAADVRFDADPIAIFLSMPSIRASWVTDVIPHGGTWANRSSSLDNQCQSAGKNRVAWCKLLEDCGYQYQFVTDDQVAADHLIEHGYRVLILNRTLCLSDAEAEAIRRFAKAGGTVIADHWCGLLDEHGNGRSQGALDDFFGLDQPATSYFGDPAQLCELNGERYQQPYLERLDYARAERHHGIVRVEDGRPVDHSVETEGRAIFLNLSLLEYFDTERRIGEYGNAWRSILTSHLDAAGLAPRVGVLDTATGLPVPLAECLLWRHARTGERTLCLVMNPTRQGSVTDLGSIDGLPGEPFEVTLEFAPSLVAQWRDLRGGKRFAQASSFTLTWDPWEAIFLGSGP